LVRNLQSSLIFLGLLLHMTSVATRLGAEEITARVAERDTPETIKGVMDCRVEALTLQKLEQGKVTSFSGYQDGPKIGDKLELNYSLQLGASPSLNATVVTVPVNSWDDLRFMFGREISGNCSVNPEYFSYNDRGTERYFSKREINFSDYSNGFHLERYYKSDYEGFLWTTPSIHSDLSLYAIAVSCQHIEDQVDEIVDRIYDVFGEQSYRDCTGMFDEKLGKSQVQITEDGIFLYRENLESE
jgi:hypothetical protein